MNNEFQMDNIERIDETDVLIVGGGPSGVSAAISAARLGVRTTLIEKFGFSGGMATAGLVGPFMTCYDKTGNTMIIRGVFSEIVERLVERGGAIHPSLIRAGTEFTSWIVDGHDHCTPFDSEILKQLLDEMLLEAGVCVLYHTTFIKAIADNGCVAGIVAADKKGLRVIKAACVIDCTGDGDAAVSVGAEYEFGNEKLGIVQPATMFFRINNVDDEKLTADVETHRHLIHRENGVSYRCFHWYVSKAREAGEWTIDRVSVNVYKGVRPGEWCVNCSRVMNVDSTDTDSITRGEIEGRRQVNEIVSFLRKYVPGCEDVRLMSSASTLGIRESRHIKGDYTLTLDDVLNGQVYADSVVLCSNSVDVHGRYGPKSGEYVTIKNGNYYGIPFRCLIPAGIENMLMAGRCISADSEAAGAVRVMPPCMAMGQAAGVAAALSVGTNTNLRSVEIKELQKVLAEQGAYLSLN